MGAIVTIKVPQGTDTGALENKIKRAISQVTSEPVQVIVSVGQQLNLEQPSTGGYLPSSAPNTPNYI